MKSRLWFVFSLVVLIVAMSPLMLPDTVRGQNAGTYRTYLPLVQAPKQHGVPRFETPDSGRVTRGNTIWYTFKLFNDGTVPDNFTVSDVSDPAQTLSGARLDYYPQGTHIYAGNADEIRMSISTSTTTPFGTDTRVLRASAIGADSSSFAEVKLTTIVAPPIPFFPTHIRNGDFEAGSTEWDVNYNEDFPDDMPNLPVIRREEGSHSGNWQLVMGGPRGSTSYAAQSITISPERPFLSYWYKIKEGAISCPIRDSYQSFYYVTVGLQATDHRPVFTDMYDLCEADDTNGQWIHRVVDLRDYVYHDLYIRMYAVNEAEGSPPTYMYIDDVELVTAP